MIEPDHIYNMDCLEGMKQMADSSVDAIICDLPYGVLNKQSEGGGWDSIIPLAPLWEQYLRVAKPSAPIILFGQGMFTSELMQSQRSLWRYNLVWDKNRPTGFLNANRMPLRVHEDICVFYRELPVYNPQMVKCAPHHRNHVRGKGQHANTNRCYGNWKELEHVISDEKFPVSIIHIDKEHLTENWHPTQKPVALLQYLIRTYTNRGGVYPRQLHGLRHHGYRCHTRTSPLHWL